MNTARLRLPWNSRKNNRTASEPASEPVGYLVNHRQGVRGVQGKGYDYVLAGNGIFVQAEGPDLTARVQLAKYRIRGLDETTMKLELHHGKIPSELLKTALQWFQETPGRERYFAIHWNGERYNMQVPPQIGGASNLEYQPLEGMLLEFHSHGRHPAFFSNTDDRDEQGFRIYGVAGRLDQPKPETILRVGIYGHFQELRPEDVFEETRTLRD